jgi:hypothetical protein
MIPDRGSLTEGTEDAEALAPSSAVPAVSSVRGIPVRWMVMR